MQQHNVSTYVPHEVETIDGRKVLSDSEEWRACCEAVHLLSRPISERRQSLARIGQKRGQVAAESLEAEMNRLEPAYLLAFDGRDSRRAYLAQIESEYGKNSRDALEARIVALWEQRKANG